MVKIEEATEFPVVLYNGDRKINVGNVKIHPTLDFKQFRTMLNHMIGISYNNLTTYLVENPRPMIQQERRKFVITSKVDFSVLVQEKNSHFLVVLKRSRSDRRRKPNRHNGLELPLTDLFDFRFQQQREIVPQIPATNKADIWLHELQMERARYLNYMIHNPNYSFDSPMNDNFPSIREVYPAAEKSTSRPSCEECKKAEKAGLKPEFHLCVYDDVLEGFFRSPVGPISRPTGKVSSK